MFFSFPPWVNIESYTTESQYNENNYNHNNQGWVTSSRSTVTLSIVSWRACSTVSSIIWCLYCIPFGITFLQSLKFRLTGIGRISTSIRRCFGILWISLLSFTHEWQVIWAVLNVLSISRTYIEWSTIRRICEVKRRTIITNYLIISSWALGQIRTSGISTKCVIHGLWNV